MGIQNFNDMRGLGELHNLYYMYDQAVYRMVRKWIANPLGPKYGGQVRPWSAAVDGAVGTLPYVINNQTMGVPDIISRLDPNRIWVRCKEHLKHRVTNIGNTIAYITVYTYVPKRTTRALVAVGDPNLLTVEQPILMDVTNVENWFNYMNESAQVRQWWWYYDPPNDIDGVASTLTRIFRPLSYLENLMFTLRFNGAREQFSLGQWLRADLRQDTPWNSFHAAAVSNNGGAPGLLDVSPWIQQRYHQANPTESGGATPPGDLPGIAAPQYKRYDFRSQWMRNYSEHLTNPASYGATLGATSAIPDDPNTAIDPVTTLPIDYSLWPQYKESGNRFIRKVFRLRRRRVRLEPGQTASFVWRGRPFTLNAVRDNLIAARSQFDLATVGNVISPTNITDTPFGEENAFLGADFRANLGVSSGGGAISRTCNNLMLRRHGDPTTTLPISYCVRGQQAVDVTQPHSMGIVPALCIVEKTYTCRFNATTVKPPRLGSNSVIFDQRTRKPFFTAGTPPTVNYAMQFPVTTTGQVQPQFLDSAYP